MGSLQATDDSRLLRSTPEKVTEAVYDSKKYDIVREGLAEILVPHHSEPTSTSGKPFKTKKEDAPKSQTVFYNPIQQYNRDLSVLAIQAFGDDWNAVQDSKRQKFAQQQVWKLRGKKRKRDAENEGDSTKAHVENGIHVVEEKEGGNDQKSTDIRGGDMATTVAEATCEEPTSKKSGNTFRILDALSATGLRALRYAKEIPLATSITANDLSASAKTSIELNIHHNNLSEKIRPTLGDAVEHMQHMALKTHGGSGHYHVVDLDPYGTAAPFLDAAVQAVCNGGLLCVTCTDAGVFASTGYLEKTYSQYGGLPLKGPHAHEGGLRLILNTIAVAAGRHGLAVEPLLSLSIDFYARVFVRVHKSPAEVKYLAGKTMIVYSCDAGCGAWSIQRLAQTRERTAKNGDLFHKFTAALGPPASPDCEHCGFKTHLAGPMWGGPLHNPHFIQHILNMLPTLDKEIYGTSQRIEGMLSMALYEALRDPPPHTSKAPGNEGTASVESTLTEHTSKDESSHKSLHTNDSNPSSNVTKRLIPPLDPVLRDNHPFFILPSVLSGTLHCVSPPEAAFRGALLHLGYRATRSHTKAGSICTDAPWSVIWEVMREWIRQKSPIKEGAIKKGTAGWGIMQKDRSKVVLLDAKANLHAALESEDLETLKEKTYAALGKIASKSNKEGVARNSDDDGRQEGDDADPTTQVSLHTVPANLIIKFDEELGKEAPSKRMVRFQVNPPDWGPMNRAKGVP